MRTILICSILALAAPAANAGDWNFRLIFGDRHDHRDHSECHCRPVQQPGHWEMVDRNVHVAAQYERRWVPARFEFRYDSCGERVRIMVSPGRFERVLVRPAHWETVCERVWVPGRTTYDCDTPGHRHGDRGYDRNDRRDRDDDRRDGRGYDRRDQRH